MMLGSGCVAIDAKCPVNGWVLSTQYSVLSTRWRRFSTLPSRKRTTRSLSWAARNEDSLPKWPGS